MQFIPKTEEEIALGNLLPEGIYPYRVAHSKDVFSEKRGNYYTSMTLDVFDKNGNQHIVFTNLAFDKLLKHFCDVNGMQEQYKSGKIAENEFAIKNGGLVHIGIEPEKANPKGGMYRAKNIVLDYVADVPEIDKSAVQVKETMFGSEDIPF